MRQQFSRLGYSGEMEMESFDPKRWQVHSKAATRPGYCWQTVDVFDVAVPRVLLEGRNRSSVMPLRAIYRTWRSLLPHGTAVLLSKALVVGANNGSVSVAW